MSWLSSIFGGGGGTTQTTTTTAQQDIEIVNTVDNSAIATVFASLNDKLTKLFASGSASLKNESDQWQIMFLSGAAITAMIILSMKISKK